MAKNKYLYDMSRVRIRPYLDKIFILYDDAKIAEVNSLSDVFAWFESDTSKKGMYDRHPLKTAIMDKGFGISDFCEESGVDRRTLYLTLQGRNRPTTYTLDKIATTLNISRGEARKLCR